MDRGRTVELERSEEREPSTDENDGRLGALRGRIPDPRPSRPRFSPRALLVAVLVALAGVVAGGFVPGLGGIGRPVGLFVAAFVYGLVAERSHYLAVGVGGALAAVLGFALNVVLGSAVVPILAGVAPEVAGIGATVGLLVALVGHYFGRDLRDGLTREV